MTIASDRSVPAARHFQTDMCTKGSRMAPDDPAVQESSAANHTALMAQAARAANMPVIHVAFGRRANGTFANHRGRLFRWITETGGCFEGTDGHAFLAAMRPRPGDIVLGGPRTSAFTGSTFAAELTSLGAVTLLLTGITTHWTAESTPREAAERGYDVAIVSGGVVSTNQATHDVAPERLSFIARVEPAQVLIAALG